MRYMVFFFLVCDVGPVVFYCLVCMYCRVPAQFVLFILLLWVYIYNMALCCFLTRICLLCIALCIIFAAMLCLSVYSVPASILHPAVMWSIVSDIRLHFLHLSSCMLVSFTMCLRQFLVVITYYYYCCCCCCCCCWKYQSLNLILYH